LDRATQVALIRRTLQHVHEHRTDLAETEVRHPVSDYYDPDQYGREVTAIYRRLPQVVCHTSQLQRPGDFVSDTLCGVPYVVVRAPSGQVNGFLNVCRHRGALLVTERSGAKLRNFVCPYHAWTYDTEGRLRQVPDQENSFPNLERGERGLVPLPTEVRHGFVWVTLQPGPPAETVERFLGPLDAELAGYRFDDHVFYREQEETRAFNWKVGMESFLENYHFAVLHSQSTNPIFVHNVIAIDGLGRHVRAVAPKRSLTRLDEADESDWDIRPNATILYAIFPNTCLFVEKGHASVLQFLPEDAERCRVRMAHVVGSDSLQLRQHWEGNIRVFMSAAVEDLMICESMQAGFRSGANEHVVFGRNEVGCDLFRSAVAEAVASS
jgi:phenylpropionate dioxygenase-like ring-hydroxylating dioxygenase large terminal subunit